MELFSRFGRFLLNKVALTFCSGRDPHGRGSCSPAESGSCLRAPSALTRSPSLADQLLHSRFYVRLLSIRTPLLDNRN